MQNINLPLNELIHDDIIPEEVMTHDSMQNKSLHDMKPLLSNFSFIGLTLPSPLPCMFIFYLSTLFVVKITKYEFRKIYILSLFMAWSLFNIFITLYFYLNSYGFFDDVES